MENKDPYGATSPEVSNGIEPLSNGNLHQPPSDLNALSLEPNASRPLILQEQPPGKVRRFLRLTRRLDVLLATLLLIVGVVVLFNVFLHKKQAVNPITTANRFETVNIPLAELLSGKDLSLAAAANVTINGTMQLNSALLLSPSLQPTGAKPGQIYYDKDNNQLAYFNGEVFVFLTGPSAQQGGLQSLGGATGQLTLGNGLALTGGQLSNSGVLSVQGQNGNVTLTAGPGIVINGTNFSNSGVLSVAAGTPNVAVADDGSGNVTVSVTGGAGTLTSSGGTVGKIPVYTAAQNVEDSIISQSGLTVTIAGDLSVITGGLSLSNALTVSNGGTGATSLANNGVLVGQGTGVIATVTAGGAGLCLLSTAGMPTWGACPGASGVTSLNGLSGALSLANASAAGSTVTIDNASDVAKGIASFSATNFSVTSGAVNTIQNINTGATPTFAGLNTNSITPSAALTVGSTGQSLTLQGSAATTLTATNGANTTALSFITPAANVTYRLQTATAGTYDICTTVGNCVSSGAVTTPGGTTNRLAKFTGSQIIGDSIITDTGTNVDIGGTLSVQGNTTLTGDIAVNGGDLTSTGALNITPGGTLTVGVTGQQLTLQGNASSSLSATNGASTTTLTFQTPTANVTYRLPTAAAGTYELCSTAGNCAGSGGGVTTSGGTTNRLAKFSGAQTINDSTITDDGTNVTTSVDLIIQGGDVTIGVANSQTGSINLAHSGSAFMGTLLQGALTANRTYTLPDANGTICLTSGNCSGAGSPNTLQAAYDAGNTITTISSRDISFMLADNATDSNFIVTAATGATGYVGIVRADGVGAADPAQLLLIDNLDTDRVQPVGIKLQSAGGGMTTAIDATDAEIVTAISIGANDILGTTGNIDLSNFDVVGATGSITTAGTVNGQTISSAASFTGTLAVAANTTLTGDIAVNGGDLTSTGALNITPGGTLTVGVTGQQLILQGSANTQLTATGGGFTTTIGFAGTPTGAVNYNFDRAAAAGTYTICTTIGNCSTAGAVTSPGGTTGAIAKFTGAQTIGDSLLSESGGTVTVNGNLNLITGNQYRINNTQISSANLSNDADLAKLSASQTFTGNTIAFQNGANSTNAFNVQNAAGNQIISVDSSNAQLVLGSSSILDGKLVFNNVANANTVTILPGTPSANRTLTLPNASGVICTDSGNCAGAGATLQTAYNFSVGGTTPKIKVNSSLGGVDIQDADSPTGANLLNIRASNGAGLGSVLFGVGNTGQVTLQNTSNSTSAFRLLTAGGTTILTGDTTNGQILLGQSGTLSGAIVFRNASNANTITLTTSTPAANRTISLPDADGTICLTSGNCSGAGSPNTLQAAYDAGNTVSTTTARDLLFTLADTATDANFLVNLQCDTSCGGNGRFGIQDDGVDVLTVSPGGAALLQPTVDSTATFNIKSSLTNNVFTVDTTNTRVGIGLGGSVTPTLQGPGIEIRGSIRISGGGIAIFDRYISPLGASLDTAINVENYNPGSFAQVIALGLPSSSDVNSRVITLLDARAGAHQPSLAVISPDENQIGGFSWDGSNSTFLTKASTNNMAFQANSLNILTLQNVSGAARLGVGLGSPSYALDVTGDANISTGSAYKINGVNICTSSGCTPAAGSGNYIQNTTTVQTNANIAIQSVADASITLLLKQRATQSADIFRVVDSNDIAIANIDTFGNAHYLGKIDALGAVGFGVASDSGVAVKVQAQADSQIGLQILNAGAGHTGNLIEVDGVGTRAFIYDASGTLQITAGSGQSADLLQLQNTAGLALSKFNSAGQLTLGRITASGTTQAGSVTLADGTTDNFGATLNTTTLTGNRTISLPNENGTICLQGSTNCSFAVTICSVTGTYICNGGNTPVSSLTIGTTNAQPLNFMTNATTRATISSTGIFQVFGNGTGSMRVGGDCASDYTAINLGGTTPFDCTSYNFLSGSSDANLYINRPSGSGILIREGNASTNQFSIATGGAVTAQNTTNTATAFRVLNATSVPQFVIDTTNSRVYIGNPTADATGALLVLDTKNTSGDPAGTNGGMYYNSNTDKFRCYQATTWRNCLTYPLLNRYYQNGSQNITTATDTKVQFPATLNAEESSVSVTGNDTFTLNKAGIWQLSANVWLSGNSGGGERYIAIADSDNVATVRYTVQNSFYGTTTIPPALSTSTTMRFSAGAKVSVVVFQASGATITAQTGWSFGTSFVLTWLGD